MTVPRHRQARRGADDLDAVRTACTRTAAGCGSGGRTGSAPAAQPDRPFPAVSPPGQPVGLARRARQRPGRQVSGHRTGIQAQQHGRQIFPVVSVMNPASPAPADPDQGAVVLQHAPPPPGPQPESPTPPQTGTMTTRHRARHARCQPRHEPDTPIATATPSTSTPRRRTPWKLSDDATPPLHRAILNGGGQPSSDSQPKCELCKITRNLTLDFTTFTCTRQRDSAQITHYCPVPLDPCHG